MRLLPREAIMEWDEFLPRPRTHRPRAVNGDLLIAGQLLRRAFPALSAERNAVNVMQSHSGTHSAPPAVLIRCSVAYRSVTRPDGRWPITDCSCRATSLARGKGCRDGDQEPWRTIGYRPLKAERCAKRRATRGLPADPDVEGSATAERPSFEGCHLRAAASAMSLSL